LPAEIILTKGGPKYKKIKGTNLSWVEKTECALFRTEKGKKMHYVLFSGRWFSTEKLDKGPWVCATSSLPPDFANIPQGHERANVLSSVPGTEEAAQAVLLASIPTIAR